MIRPILATAITGFLIVKACSGTQEIDVRDNALDTCKYYPHIDGGMLVCTPPQPPNISCPDATPCWQLEVLGPQTAGTQTWNENLCPACCADNSATFVPSACSPLVCSDTLQCVVYGIQCVNAACQKTVTCDDGGGCI